VSDNPHNETIYILDEVTTKPGQGEAFLAAYMEKYAPGARARGMTLVHRWVSPPLWLKEQSNTVYVIWSVHGANGWWGMSFLGRGDPAVAAWWADAEEMIVCRKRRFLSDVGDMDSLADV
jgi:hypothetical protein